MMMHIVNSDLLVTLFNKYINKPDILSVEYDYDEMPFIRFEWFGGSVKDFPYTSQRYDSIWCAFNRYWSYIGIH